jgi:hypothetical protein
VPEPVADPVGALELVPDVPVPPAIEPPAMSAVCKHPVTVTCWLLVLEP